MIELEDLLQTLELSGYLQIDGLFHLAQLEVAERRLVDPLNLSDGECACSRCHRCQTNPSTVRNRAPAINADVLTRWCDEYEKINRDYIRMTAEENATLN